MIDHMRFTGSDFAETAETGVHAGKIPQLHVVVDATTEKKNIY